MSPGQEGHGESSQSEGCDHDSMETQQDLAARLRRMEKQHASDKAAWKLKLEGALASARQASEEKEVISHKYEQLKEQHDKAVQTHKEEKKRLEINSQESEREFKKSMEQLQSELKIKISESTAESKNLQAAINEQSLAHKNELADLTSQYKKEKDEMVGTLTVQRSQIGQLKEANQKALELCEQLAAEQKKYSKEQRQAQSSQHSSSLEIAFLREEINAVKLRENDLITSSQGKIEALKAKLESSKRREQAVVMSMVELQNKLRDHARLIENQDEQLDAWAATAAKLEDCLSRVIELESRSTESLQVHVEGMITSLKRHFNGAAKETQHLAGTCAQLRSEVVAWKFQFEELEKSVAKLKKASAKDQKVLEELRAKNRELEMALENKHHEVMEWEANYSKIELCVEDLMKLENETSEGYQERINHLLAKNENLEKKALALERRCRELVSENAGLRVDDELGLEAVLSGYASPKRASTPATENDDDSVDFTLNK
ncbi:hypothetical protein ACA910_003775 [Epithemia clementina (nom. ined.)]